MRDLVLPIHFVRDSVLVGGSSVALKTLLLVVDRLHAQGPAPEAVPQVVPPAIDEFDGEVDADTSPEGTSPAADDEVVSDGVPVRVSLRDLVDLTGAVESSLRRSASALTGIRVVLPPRRPDAEAQAQADDDSEVEPEVDVQPVTYAGGGLREGDGASLLVEVDARVAAFCASAPDSYDTAELRVPYAELRPLKSRCAVLLLLAGLVELHARPGRRPVRCRVDAGGMPRYTGHRVAGGRAPSLRAYVDDYLAPAAEEVNAASGLLRVRVDTVDARVRERAPDHEALRPTRYRQVDISFDHVRRQRGSAVPDDAAEPV